MQKKLYRSEDNKMLAGVCGGIAEYFNIDPTLVRVIWAAVSIFGGGGVLLYIIMAIIVPVKSSVIAGEVKPENKTEEKK